MVIHFDIFENNKVTLFPYFTFIFKTGISFYYAIRSLLTEMNLTLSSVEWKQ